MAKIISQLPHRGTGKRKILYGCTYTLDDGRKVYMAFRRHAKIYTGKSGTISKAMQEEVAAWSFDESLLFNLRAKKVEFIGVRERDTEYRYLTRLSCYFDRKVYRTKSYSGIGATGKVERHVPLQFFQCHKAPLKIRSKIQTY